MAINSYNFIVITDRDNLMSRRENAPHARFLPRPAPVVCFCLFSRIIAALYSVLSDRRLFFRGHLRCGIGVRGWKCLFQTFSRGYENIVICPYILFLKFFYTFVAYVYI